MLNGLLPEFWWIFQEIPCVIFMGMKFVVVSTWYSKFDIDTNEELTWGYGILQRCWIQSNWNKVNPEMLFYTQNPVGKENMKMYYKNFYFKEKEE